MFKTQFLKGESNENHECGAFLALAMIPRHTLRIATSVTQLNPIKPPLAFFFFLKHHLAAACVIPVPINITEVKMVFS